MIKDRIGISHSDEGTQIADVLTDVDVFKFVFPSLDLFMNVVAIRAGWHAIDFYHVSFLLISFPYLL